MTACATVADVLALAPTPYELTNADLRRAFGIGYPRARVVLTLAREAHQRKVEAQAATLGVLPSQADTVLQREWRSA